MSPAFQPTAAQPAKAAQVLDGRHVLISILAFFGIVFAVNGVLLFKALSTHSGVVANEPYAKGLAYNERIDASARQQNLGWHEAVELDAKGRFGFALVDSEGRPITDLHVTAVLGRPSTGRHDIRLQAVETNPGRYAATAGPLQEGAWLLRIEARHPVQDLTLDKQPIYRLTRRIWLKP